MLVALQAHMAHGHTLLVSLYCSRRTQSKNCAARRRWLHHPLFHFPTSSSPAQSNDRQRPHDRPSDFNFHCVMQQAHPKSIYCCQRRTIEKLNWPFSLCDAAHSQNNCSSPASRNQNAHVSMLFSNTRHCDFNWPFALCGAAGALTMVPTPFQHR